MGWTAIFDVINKILPSREERIRNKIKAFENEKQDLLTKPPTVDNTKRMQFVINELRKLKETLENR
jgi:hypothetical protein